jgi:hypothetical protein
VGAASKLDLPAPEDGVKYGSVVVEFPFSAPAINTMNWPKIIVASVAICLEEGASVARPLSRVPAAFLNFPPSSVPGRAAPTKDFRNEDGVLAALIKNDLRADPLKGRFSPSARDRWIA